MYMGISLAGVAPTTTSGCETLGCAGGRRRFYMWVGEAIEKDHNEERATLFIKPLGLLRFKGSLYEYYRILVPIEIGTVAVFDSYEFSKRNFEGFFSI
jgi:hypothetical protein